MKPRGLLDSIRHVYMVKGVGIQSMELAVCTSVVISQRVSVLIKLWWLVWSSRVQRKLWRIRQERRCGTRARRSQPTRRCRSGDHYYPQDHCRCLPEKCNKLILIIYTAKSAAHCIGVRLWKPLRAGKKWKSQGRYLFYDKILNEWQCRLLFMTSSPSAKVELEPLFMVLLSYEIGR